MTEKNGDINPVHKRRNKNNVGVELGLSQHGEMVGGKIIQCSPRHKKP